MSDEEDKDMKVDDDKKEEGKAYGGNPAMNIFSSLDFDAPKYKENLIYKRERKPKAPKKPPSEQIVELLGKKRKRIEPTVRQQLLNDVIKTADYTTEGVKEAAIKRKMVVSDKEAKFIAELGKTKVTVKKLGIPPELCKKPLHLFLSIGEMGDTMKFVTDDSLLWKCLYNMVRYKDRSTISKYENFLVRSTIKKFSMVSDVLSVNGMSYSGYAQDKERNYFFAKTENGNYSSGYVKQLLDFGAGVYGKTNIKMSGGAIYTFLGKGDAVIIAPAADWSKPDGLATKLSDTRMINSKNKLASGMKEIKNTKKDQIGTYLNIHDMAVTDFVPSVLFFEKLENVRMFLNIELDKNAFYNALPKADNYKTMVLNLPKNCVFWDNLESYVEMLNIAYFDNDKFSYTQRNDFNSIYVEYSNYKTAFNAWRILYYNFEDIITGYYDSITTKVTYDQIMKLQDKVNFFIDNYYYLTEHATYIAIRTFFSELGVVCEMMNIFVSTKASIDAIECIKKVIRLLATSNTTKLEDFVRVTGVLCLQCMYDGDYAMIPKVRSKAAFLGNVTGEKITGDVLRRNIVELTKQFNERLIKGLEDAKKGPDVLTPYKKMNQIIKTSIENTIRRYKNYKFKGMEDVIRELLDDPVLRESIAEETAGWIESGDFKDEELLNLDYLYNFDVLNQLQAFDQIATKVFKAFGKEGLDNIGKTKVKEVARIPGAYKKFKARKKGDTKKVVDTGLPAPAVLEDFKKNYGSSLVKIPNEKIVETITTITTPENQQQALLKINAVGDIWEGFGEKVGW